MEFSLIMYSDSFLSFNFSNHEIQTAKDLLADYNSFPNEDKTEAAKVLSDLIIQISTHKSLLQLKVNKLSEQYSVNFEKLKGSELEIFQSIILPLADAMEQSGEYSDETYIRQVTSMTTQSFMTMNRIDDVKDWVKLRVFIAQSFVGSPDPLKEKVLAILLGYSKTEWQALKNVDPEGDQLLLKATEDLINAFLIPTKKE